MVPRDDRGSLGRPWAETSGINGTTTLSGVTCLLAGGVNGDVAPRNTSSDYHSDCYRRTRGMPNSILLVLGILVLSLAVPAVDAVKWLALHHTDQRHWNQTVHCVRSKVHGLVSKQVKICKNNLDLMSPVAHATRVTVAACQQLFQDRRWNCSSIKNAPKLPPDLTSGTREQAFVYALSAAAVAHAVARSCSTGGTTRCSCGRLPREAPDGDFKWGGCSDNTRFGAQFGKLFVDAPWTKSSSEGSNKRTKSSLNFASNSASAVPPPEVVTTATPGVKKKKRKRSHSRSKRALMNRHNNEAGRQALLLSLATSCKCHGVSGSCSLKTCWKALPDLITVGSLIRKKYQIAVEVTKRKVGKKKMLVPIDPHRIMFGADEMVYYTKSPDYCSPEKKLGSIGTHGRECKKDSEGSDGCGSMCCGRGFYSYTKLVKERCHCKYYWCCYVKCKTCTKNVEVHTCK